MVFEFRRLEATGPGRTNGELSVHLRCNWPVEDKESFEVDAALLAEDSTEKVCV